MVVPNSISFLEGTLLLPPWGQQLKVRFTILTSSRRTVRYRPKNCRVRNTECEADHASMSEDLDGKNW